jgi:hypothetical protein
MSITISPEAEMLKNTIMDLFEISKIDTYVMVEALCAIVVEYTDAFMDCCNDRKPSSEEVEKILKDAAKHMG